ncbi:MAG: twin-arginine translocase TatA/TatE family subunit [Candidatus Binatia bacterium]
MFGLGIWELLIILIIILVLFSGKLPEVGEGIGKGIRKFRKTLHESDEIDITPEEEQKKEEKDKDSSKP